MEISETDPCLNKKQGAFVSLHDMQGRLRGCIGAIIGEQPLYLTIRNMSIEAAVNDPRFPPLESSELKDIEIEISVLSELKKINDHKLIEIGRHGVMVKKGAKCGVFLPQVGTQTGWTREQFLSILCQEKAGLPTDSWCDGSADLYIFTAEVFKESACDA